MVFKATQGATWRGFVPWRWDKVFPKEGVLTWPPFLQMLVQGPRNTKWGELGEAPPTARSLQVSPPLPHHSGPGRRDFS